MAAKPIVNDKTTTKNANKPEKDKKFLVVVESPAKAKTIEKYLGPHYKVLASFGHVRDLLPKSGSVDTEHNFDMKYSLIERNQKHVDNIIKAIKGADELLLATDPDREGEAISWHIVQILEECKALKNKPVHRVVFHEITKAAILDAVAHPRAIAMDLVNAQQARRALDYLVGFNLSPLLWKKIRRGLSAGRVQSPALRLIVERELEIEKFQTQEYWTIVADNKIQQQSFNAKLSEFEGEKLKQFTLTSSEHAERVKKTLNDAAKGKLLVSNVEKKQRKRNPAPPFITSTLQQEAARKLGYTTRKTMMLAQQLYEGVEVGSATVGLITYMRTDSVNLSADAISEMREFIGSQYGNEFLPKEARQFKTKSKNAQEAHEAIRPTSVKRTPALVKEALTSDQFRLYELIWKRALASQMAEALIDTVAADLACGDKGVFRANGSTIKAPGFMMLYLEGKDDSASDDSDEKILPEMKVGDIITLENILCNQHFTEPPPRYSEASLVKALEEYDIGRPSTYASIIYTLQQREYVILDKKRFFPTDIGRIVNGFLTDYFTQYVDYNFTAGLEDQLDAVSRGEKAWIPLLEEFWRPFTQQITTIETEVKRSDVTTEVIEEKCPKCEKALAIRLGKRGRFIGCTAYPECDYTRNLDDAVEQEVEIIPDRKCPSCHSDLQIRNGKYGKFIGCTGYPNCKHIEPLEKPKDLNVTCPKCKKGSILERKSRRGKIFFSCSGYPDCDYALWNEPINEPCPKCQWPILTVKNTKRSGNQKICPQAECGHVENISDE